MAQAEARLVKKITVAVKKDYPAAVVWKFSDRFNRGLLDLAIIFPTPSRFAGAISILFVEVKTETGKPSKLQEMTVLSIPKAWNCQAIFATTPQEVLDKMKSM